MANGYGQWLWPMAMANGYGQWPWPMALANGQWPWPMANGHGQWPWPRALAKGQWPWPGPMAMANGPGHGPLAMAIGHGHWSPFVRFLERGGLISAAPDYPTCLQASFFLESWKVPGRAWILLSGPGRAQAGAQSNPAATFSTIFGRFSSIRVKICT